MSLGFLGYGVNFSLAFFRSTCGSAVEASANRFFRSAAFRRYSGTNRGPTKQVALLAGFTAAHIAKGGAYIDF